MMFDFIGENNRNQLCDTGKDQISMQCLLVLCPASCETEMIFHVVDISFDNSPFSIGVISFLGSADRSGISQQILFRIDITHTPASGSGTRIFTAALSERFLGGFLVSPSHFGAD